MSVIVPVFTRASSAYKLDGSLVPSGVPRFESGRPLPHTAGEATVNLLDVATATCTSTAGLGVDAGVTVTVDPTAPYAGNSSIKVVTIALANIGIFTGSVSGYPVVRNIPHSASIVMKGVGTVTFTVKFYPSNIVFTKNITLTSTFQRYTFENVIGAISDSFVRIIVRTIPALPYTFWIANLQIEPLPYATDFVAGYRAGNQALMVEEGTTNDFGTFSNTFVASWTLVALTGGVAQYAPNNLVDADSLWQTTANSNHHVQHGGSIFTDNSIITQSVYLKVLGNAKYIYLQGKSKDGTVYPGARFDLLNGVIQTTYGCTATIYNTGGGYFRCSITYNIGVGTLPSYFFIMAMETGSLSVSFVGVVTDGFSAWRAQQEVKPYVTSWTPDTRISELLNISNPIDVVSGSACMWVKNIKPPTGSALNLLSHQSALYKDYLIISKYGNQWRAIITSNAAVDSSIGANRRELTVTDTFATDEWVHAAFTWSATEFAMFLNSVKVASYANPPVPSVNGILSVGSNVSASQCNTLIDDLRLFTEPLRAGDFQMIMGGDI
jgi:hypothetical protein